MRSRNRRLAFTESASRSIRLVIEAARIRKRRSKVSRRLSVTFLRDELFTVFSVSHKYLVEALLRGRLPFDRRSEGIAAELPEPQIPGDKRRRAHYKPRGSLLRDDATAMWNAEGLDGVWEPRGCTFRQPRFATAIQGKG